MPHDVVLLNCSSGRLRQGYGEPRQSEATAGTFREVGLYAQIEGLFRSHGADVIIHEVTTPLEIPRAARDALDHNAGAIIAGGGDGTVNAVASVLAGGPTLLGVLPLGTLNHFAKDLQIPHDLDKAVETIVRRHVRKVDVGCVGDWIFVNNSSIGIYPSIIEIASG